jgi:hypothetical protein
MQLVEFIIKEATVKVTASLSVRSLLVATVSCRNAACGYMCSNDVWTRNKLSFAPACGVSRLHLETLKKFLTLNWRPLLRNVSRTFSIFHFASCRPRIGCMFSAAPGHTNFLAAKFVSVCHTHTHTCLHFSLLSRLLNT